ncbi:Beta-galactosidase GanA [Duganella sp. CF402]|uniref:GH35 family beta-galactosidase n=1 Tax=unclassified Duganella TaxID=2636909 RepID=UPI0008B0F5F7|nr:MULTISPECIES: DUF5597 domain-containing protein [unclassified Duganella]RZT08211.1 beta-galactosidase GanA [Duganella sp. BK701]SEM02026.1 Beta-galactosidase GanA [Duganella sp. CF402]
MFKHLITLLVAALAAPLLALASDPLPALNRSGATTQLLVDGEPFLMLAGELHNSSASSDAYMAQIWPKLKAMHLNTVVSTISWDMIEPSEGKFDFSALDSQLAAARKNDLRIVMIWFGSFKNARSTYSPGWIRADQERFPRVAINRVKPQRFTYEGAMPNPVLSPFSTTLQEAERNAFTAMLRHLKKADPEHTVLMIQVDNEIGLLGDSRDRSALAQRHWQEQVPADLMAYLARNRATLRPELASLWGRQQFREQGTWAEVFGTDWQADEVFMAWAYGRFINGVVQDGGSELPLPLYVNAWLGPQPGQPEAGDYPSGGPVPRVRDIWKAAAPSISLHAPDIYIDDFKGTLANFDQAGNPIFIPEARFQTGNAFWAIGRHRALGFSVFGIEDGFPGNQLSQAYAILSSMARLITAAQRNDGLRAVLLDDAKPVMERLAGYDIAVRGTAATNAKMLLDAGIPVPPKAATAVAETVNAAHGPSFSDTRPFGLIIAGNPGEFYLVGHDFTADFSRDGKAVELDFVEEGRFERGAWVPGRRLNGDQRLSLLPLNKITTVRIQLLQAGAAAR